MASQRRCPSSARQAHRNDSEKTYPAPGRFAVWRPRFRSKPNRNHPGKWNKVGRVVEILSFDQYVIKVDGSGRITKRNRRFLRLSPISTTDQLTLPGPEYAHPILYRPNAASPDATFDNEEQACSTNEAGFEPPTTSPSEHTPLSSTLDSPSPKLQDTPEVSFPNTPTLMRRSTRTLRPALKLDPASGQWVTRGFVSSLDRATNWGEMQNCKF